MSTPRPRVLHELGDSGPPGVAWRLDEPGRQLDANVIGLAPGQTVEAHTENELDVLLVVVSGTGLVEGAAPVELVSGALVWLPRGSTRSLRAGETGLRYLTVHRRRPGLRITGPPSM